MLSLVLGQQIFSSDECTKLKSEFEKDMKTEWKSSKDFPLYKYTGCLQYLKKALENVAHPDAKECSFSPTALEEAVGKDNHQVADFLLQMGADPSKAIRKAQSYEMIHKLINYGAKVNASQGVNAIFRSSPGVLKAMLERGVSQEQIHEAAETLLCIGCRREAKSLEGWIKKKIFPANFSNSLEDCIPSDYLKRKDQKVIDKEVNECQKMVEMIKVVREFDQKTKPQEVSKKRSKSMSEQLLLYMSIFL